jgi:hypothetical protein
LEIKAVDCAILFWFSVPTLLFFAIKQWTGGLRPRWAKKPWNTFTAALEGLRTAISFLFIDWCNLNPDLFTSYQGSLGYIWA